jgi:mannose-1-phosphate guanylyltransferase/mannose-6-phosphate isomerase
MTDANHTLVPVVLSGGSGTRLWPASRLTQPKQLLPLVDNRTMLRATVDRVATLEAAANPIVVANADHADVVTRELLASGYPDATLILEPVGRNTAPAVAVAAMEAMKRGDPLMLVLPADHTIGDEEAFQSAIASATEAAIAGYLVTFGITPAGPETGYGYVRIGSEITPTVNRVVEFKEKPDAQAASEYVASGEYLWNSGMFLMRASRYLEELEQHAPDIAESAAAAFKTARIDGNTIHLDPAAFASGRSDSIDYAVMEPTSMAAVVPTDPDWNDVGSWASLWDIADKDDGGNAFAGDVLAVDTSGTYVRTSERLVATVGVEDMIIVDTPDALLVARRESAQDVKTVVDALRQAGRTELDTDGTGLRPWGRFRTVESGVGFRVVHLWIDPGGRTALRTRENGSAHCLVLDGIARITTADTTRLVPSAESVHIPPGESHRIENPGDDTIEVIEVSIGLSDAMENPAGHPDSHGRTENNE